MSVPGVVVLDGTHLRSLHVSLPVADVNFTGAQLLDLADSKASDSLFGLSLPSTIKLAALTRMPAFDDATFRSTELTGDRASKLLHDYLSAIADVLKDDPLVVSILDGNSLRLFLEDEDDFAMLAENLFTDLDTEDKGKISKSEIRNALVHMGVDMGIPPFSEFPLLNEILKKHGAEGEEELGQAQFAELLQPILQEIADALAEKHVVAIQNIKIVNGSHVRKLLEDEKQMNDVMDKILLEKDSKKKDEGSAQIIRGFLEKHAKELGLPPSEGNEAAVLLYDSVFANMESSENADELDTKFREQVKNILENLAELLESNPVYCVTDN
ncbi:Calcium-binding EF hand family protein [Tripterygium wilfordii]|uniref:Calcium-binding EF hand family protein n=1 Tax=Tripterygium wilfordii TaxID=458696 RepID=A0A7J7D2G8_TRIWF|nr:uncharacterized protein LOC120008448 [Tripterygium wilfordii]KAF5740521.1 Calcium-binding EF hand family protein [Tripterygium wilfordii]